MKPRIFIGSSVEGLPIAYSIQENLEYSAESTIWDQGIFELTAGTLENLIKTLATNDFGVFVFSPDDTIVMRNSNYKTVRDNVIFELGLFIGSLGKERTFFIIPRGIKDFQIPTDLAGITPASYDPNRQDGNLNAALGPACNKIRRAIQKIGPLHPSTDSIHVLKNENIVQPNTKIRITDLRRNEVINKLEELFEEGQKVFTEVKDTSSFEIGEQRLSRWKFRVVYFLDSNISFDEAISFVKIVTALGGALPLDHLISSYLGHSTFLEALIEEIKADTDFLIKAEALPSGNDLPKIDSFTYNSGQEMKWSSGRKHIGELTVSESEKMKLEQQVRQGMPLAGIILDGADLQRAMLREVNFEKASLKGVNLYGADLWRANLQAANLESANLAGAGLWASFLDGANLQKTNLEKSMLDKARLRSTDLRGANLKAASLEKADLKDAKIQDANLEKTNLRRAYLGGVEGFEEVRSLSGTILIDVEGLTQEQIEFARSRGSKVSDN